MSPGKFAALAGVVFDIMGCGAMCGALCALPAAALPGLCFSGENEIT
jgi:hypothetical protein